MSFKLPPLPYGFKDLLPHLSEETLTFHYTKHHAGYVNKLNGLVKDTALASKTLEELIKTEAGAVFNNAAQVWNHTFYWNSIGPNCGGEPVGLLRNKLNARFGSFANFKDEFSAVLTGHFGSGWGWLVLKSDGTTDILQTHDADTPIRQGLVKPLLVCDVWEHAYYLDYKNDRAKYVDAWWKLVNWDFANKNLEKEFVF